MPKSVTETLGAGDQSWIGEPGPWKARSQSLLKSAFTAGTHYPNGYLPSGTAVAQYTSGGNSGKYGPYTSGATDGSQNLAGFTIADVAVTSDANINVALYDHGRVNTNRLPLSFTAPASPGRFTFLTQS